MLPPPPPPRARTVVATFVSVVRGQGVRTVTLTANVGTVSYDEAAKVVKWHVGNLGPHLGKAPQLQGRVSLGGAKLEEEPPVHLDWKVPNSSVSGIGVASLALTSEQYRPYKGVRTITRSGKFVVRSS